MSLDSDIPLLREWGKYRQPPRRSPPAWAWLLIAVSLVGALGAAVWRSQHSHPWQSRSGAPHFRSCGDEGRLDAWCGRLQTAFDPAKPRGRKISLRITVLPATRRPAVGALFYLEGGPGGAASAAAVRVSTFFARVQRRRDIVLVDQRGTGSSNRLACPGGYVPAADSGAVAAYLRRCFARLDADPRLYTTSVAAADLESVRRSLGYGKIDLYGGSYGATLAQAYVRRYPRSVRSVVLDSGSLSSVRIYDVAAPNAEHAYDALAARCRAAPACSQAYPDLKGELRKLLARPPRVVSVPTGKVLLHSDDVAWTVDWLSQTATNAAIIPYAVNAAANGDYTMIAGAYADQLGGSNLDPLARLVPFWEIICSEPWAAFDPAATALAARGSYLASAAVARARLFRRACRVIPRGRVAADAESQRTVRVPTLLLAGSADPLDPPANLRGWRRVFLRGRLVVVRGAGHGTIEYGCVQSLVARFVARGASETLDAACARRVSVPELATG
jgi:pimeloyl-ACP methyl ester carboxylesterase